MKTLMLSVVALLVAAPAVYAQNAEKKPTDPPTSEEEVRWMLNDAVATARQIETLDKELAGINEEGQAAADRIKAHNDLHPGGCYFPVDNPHACDGWVQESKDLNDRLRELVGRHRAATANRSMARSHLSITFARLRLLNFLMLFTDWEQQVRSCMKKTDFETAHRCLVDAWENHP